MNTNLITTPQAAKILGVRPNTLEAWRIRGTGPRFRKIGRLVKYVEGDLAAYVEAQTRQSTSELAR